MHPHDPCTSFRRAHATDPRVLAERERGHQASCAACRNWFERRRRAVQVVATVDRVAAPAALDRRVAEEVTLASLPRLAAPTVLGRLVREELGAGSSADVVRSLASLSRPTAPVELDSLVAEALEPGGHTEQARGSHPRVLRAVRAFRSHRAIAAPILAAAALLLVLDLVRDSGQPQRPRPRLDLVMASSPASLDPLAAGLLTGLRGAPLAAPSAEGSTSDQRAEESR